MFKQFNGVAPAVAVAAALGLSACAQLDQQPYAFNAESPASGPYAAAVASGGQTTSRTAAAKSAPQLGKGEQQIIVGTAGGYHRTLKVTAPSQVCDQNAFADGVRYGYALTWNRQVTEETLNGGGKSSRRRFDSAAVHSQDDQYKIQWDGKERTNACASDGYLIGRIVGTHMAGVDMRDGKSS
jgi:hypothetical protein